MHIVMQVRLVLDTDGWPKHNGDDAALAAAQVLSDTADHCRLLVNASDLLRDNVKIVIDDELR